MNIILTLILVFSASMASAKASKCTYQIDQEHSKLQGTGYKYTNKTGVTADFTGVELSKTEKAKSVAELLKGLVVTVDLMTLDSGNALRDKNLRETLFAGILGDSVAKVTVKKVTDDKISTELKINEKTQAIDFNYSVKNDILKATGQFDALSFALGEQIEALKKRCGSLHTGEDGKSVTWTDFALAVTAKLKKVCK